MVDAVLEALALVGAIGDPAAWNRITIPLLAQWHAAQAFPQAVPPLGPLPIEIDDSDDENHGANALATVTKDLVIVPATYADSSAILPYEDTSHDELILALADRDARIEVLKREMGASHQIARRMKAELLAL